MELELSNAELVFLYGTLKKDLEKLEAIEAVSLVKSDIKLYKNIIKKMEASAPRLKDIPI